MDLDIETILWLRLFVLRNTESRKIYNRQRRETALLVDKLKSGEVTYVVHGSFVYLNDKTDTTVAVVRIVPVEKIPSVDPISRRKNQKLYRWNSGGRNELISRKNLPEERRRVEFLPPGYYFVSNRIDGAGTSLYYVTKNFLPGYVKYRKLIAGVDTEFRQRKNKGDIYRICVEKDIFVKEQERLFDHSDIVHSAYVAHNSEVFPKILQLYVPKGSKVADVTYGTGKFWDKIDMNDYECYHSDLTDGIDARHLPHEDKSLDCIVFDPPFLIPTRNFHTTSKYEHLYKLNKSWRGGDLIRERDHSKAIMKLYVDQMVETKRVLVNNGIYVVKTQDTVGTDSRFHMFHIWIINELVKHGFLIEDIFVVVRKTYVHFNFIGHQRHSRKNHSYFIVAKKSVKRNMT